MKKQFQATHWFVVGLTLLSFALSAYFSRQVFERLPHLEDEMAYIFQARAIAGGNFVVPSLDPSTSYWQPFVVDRDGVRFGKYTVGWPLQLAVGEVLGQSWVINAFFASLTVAVVYRLGAEIFNRDTGVIAATLTAFSPAVVLLSASLMGHTSALFWTTLFMYAFWRIEKRRKVLRWGLLAGVALGFLIASRPLTALAIAAPFVTWSLVGLVREIPHWGQIWRTLKPLLLLSVISLTFSLLVPLYNLQATGKPTDNLYLYVWDYDQVGFGEGYGRNTHTLEKGVRHMRFDLSLSAADLFGWQLGTVLDANGQLKPELHHQFTVEGNYYPIIGISWILLPLGFIVIFRKQSHWVFLWFALGLAWLAFPFSFEQGRLITDPQFAWVCLIGLMIWVCAPLILLRDAQKVWVWMLIGAAISLIIFQLAYWIGSQRYSTRYYFEGLTALAIISALPLAWVAQNVNRRALYVGLTIVTVGTFFIYTVPRIGALRGFNLINGQLLTELEARRNGDQPVLVIINGTDVRWRAYATLMAQTNPYLTSDIVAARASSESQRQQILDRFPDRQVIEMQGQENSAWFIDDTAP